MFTSLFFCVVTRFQPAPFPPLPSLRRLTYGSFENDIGLRYAVQQLESVESAPHLVEIYLNTSPNKDGHIEEGLYRSLDILLCGTKFPSLQRVWINIHVPFHLLPNLRNRGVLEVL